MQKQNGRKLGIRNCVQKLKELLQSYGFPGKRQKINGL